MGAHCARSQLSRNRRNTQATRGRIFPRTNMKKRYKIPLALAFVLALGIGVLGIVLSRDAPCTPAADSAGDARAWRYRCYGGPSVMELVNLSKPVPADDEVLVRVHAAATNPLDWHYLRGIPYVMRLDAGIGAPKSPTIGVDFAGVVEATGKSVTKFKPGDEVFGGRDGAFADYLVVRESRNIVQKPANISFVEAAAVPIAAVTALQALRDKGKVHAGQKVLINGASGGVGTFAIQLAKNFGADVTGVCSARNVDMVKSIGADHVVDYTKEDFTTGSVKYDLIIDTVGTHSFSDYRRAMADDAMLVIVGGPNDGKFLGPMTVLLKAPVYSKFVSQHFQFMLADLDPADLDYLRGLLAAGKLKPVIDKTFKFAEAPEAIRYLETGHARGKVVIDLD
jgi:NADPH:quinone reductase-like Zn-dependent oxidoreductase